MGEYGPATCGHVPPPPCLCPFLPPLRLLSKVISHQQAGAVVPPFVAGSLTATGTGMSDGPSVCLSVCPSVRPSHHQVPTLSTIRLPVAFVSSIYREC